MENFICLHNCFRSYLMSHEELHQVFQYAISVNIYLNSDGWHNVYLSHTFGKKIQKPVVKDYDFCFVYGLFSEISLKSGVFSPPDVRQLQVDNLRMKQKQRACHFQPSNDTNVQYSYRLFFAMKEKTSLAQENLSLTCYTYDIAFDFHHLIHLRIYIFGKERYSGSDEILFRLLFLHNLNIFK